MKKNPIAYFPIAFSFGEYGSDGRSGNPVKNAGTIYIISRHPIECQEDELLLKTSLKKMIDGMIDILCGPDKKVSEEENVLAVRSLQIELFKQIDRLEKCLADKK